MLARIARSAAPRRIPAAFAPVSARCYSDKFQEKEAAQEGQYAKQQEHAQLAKLKEQIEAAKKSLAELEKAHDDKAKTS